MEQRVNAFKARDANNNIYTVIEYQSQIPCGTLTDPTATRAGLSRFVTDDGYPVNKINKREFLLVQGNIPLYLC